MKAGAGHVTAILNAPGVESSPEHLSAAASVALPRQGHQTLSETAQSRADVPSAT